MQKGDVCKDEYGTVGYYVCDGKGIFPCKGCKFVIADAIETKRKTKPTGLKPSYIDEAEPIIKGCTGLAGSSESILEDSLVDELVKEAFD
jgi:hypothetical protein